MRMTCDLGSGLAIMHFILCPPHRPAHRCVMDAKMTGNLLHCVTWGQVLQSCIVSSALLTALLTVA